MLKARKKITKREIKEDPLVTFYVRTQKFLQKHSKPFYIGILAVIVIATFIMLDSRSRRTGNIRAEYQRRVAALNCILSVPDVRLPRPVYH